jgi:glycosyltransferase involved in cell wall biosynthesis
MSNLTVAMIVKNEEQFIKKVIQNVQPVADEIVITDTGSTDKTLDIIKKFKVRLLHYKWDGDEAKARNFCLSQCKKDWILCIDADEFIDKNNYPEICKLISNKDRYIAYRIVLRHYFDPQINFKNLYQWKGSYILHTIIRIFKNKEGIFFSKPLYTSVDESLRDRLDEIGNTNIVFHHLDILRNKQKKIEKAKWFYSSVFDNFKKSPNEPEVNYIVAHYWSLHGEFKRAIKYYKKTLRLNPEYIKAKLGLGLSYIMSGEEEKGLRLIKTCQNGKQVFPREIESYLNSTYKIIAGRMFKKRNENRS